MVIIIYILLSFEKNFKNLENKQVDYYNRIIDNIFLSVDKIFGKNCLMDDFIV
jgi:hypothetical protein